MSDPSSTTVATQAAAKRRPAAAPTKAATKPAAKRPAAAAPAPRAATRRVAAKRVAAAPVTRAGAKRQPGAAPARRAAAKRVDQSTPARAEAAVERGELVATSAPTRAPRKLSGHLPPPAPQVTLPVTGWTFMLPPRREWPWIGGVVLVAALDIIDWPVALIIAIGHTIMTNSHNEQLRELADGVEAAL